MFSLRFALPTELCENIARIFRFSYIKFLLFILVLYGQMLCQLSYARIFSFPRNITNPTKKLGLCPFRQLSTFPGSHPPSIIDVKGLNFCVRHGNRWIPLAIVTGFLSIYHTLKTKQHNFMTFFLFL